MLPSLIVNQLTGVFLRENDQFSVNADISSLTRSGSVITATTTSAHGLAPGGRTLVTGAKTPILVSSLTRIGDNALAITDTRHNLTVNDTTVEILGADQADYNGVKTRVSPTIFDIESITIAGSVATVTTSAPHGFIVDPNFEVTISGVKQAAYNKTTAILATPTSTTFTYEVFGVDTDAVRSFSNPMRVQQHTNAFTFVFAVANTPITPATGTIHQVKTFQQGYNGSKTVATVPTTTSFTYAISSTPLSPALGGSIQTRYFSKITTAASLEDAIEHYQTFVKTQKWLYVVMGDEVVSRNTLTVNDSSSMFAQGYSFKELNIQTVNIFVFLPNQDETLGMSSIDEARALKKPIYKALLGVEFDSEISTKYWGLEPKFNGFQARNAAYYIHNYEFESSNYIYNEDIVDPVDAGVFREFCFDDLDEDGNVVMEINGRVDD